MNMEKKKKTEKDLFFCQIAGRIVAPDVAGDGFGSDAEIAVADVDPAAAAAFGCIFEEERFSVFETGHDGV